MRVYRIKKVDNGKYGVRYIAQIRFLYFFWFRLIPDYMSGMRQNFTYLRMALTPRLRLHSSHTEDGLMHQIECHSYYHKNNGVYIDGSEVSIPKW